MREGGREGGGREEETEGGGSKGGSKNGGKEERKSGGNVFQTNAASPLLRRYLKGFEVEATEVILPLMMS